jgi:hypothetical protein
MRQRRRQGWKHGAERRKWRRKCRSSGDEDAGRRGHRGRKRTKARHVGRHDRRTRRSRGNRKDNRKLSIEFPDQRKRNFCRLGRLKARPEQSPPHCCRDAHRPRWRYSTTRAPEGSTRATAWQPAQRSWSKRATARMPLSATQHASAHPFSSTSS